MSTGQGASCARRRSFPGYRRAFQQSTVLGRQIVHNLRETRPERLGVDAGAGHGVIHDKVVQFLGYMQSVDRDPIRHVKDAPRTQP
jgi:hypothetical protein